MHLLHQCNLALLHFSIDEKAIHFEEIGKINILYPIKTGIKMLLGCRSLFFLNFYKYCMHFPPKIVLLTQCFWLNDVLFLSSKFDKCWWNQDKEGTYTPIHFLL